MQVLLEILTGVAVLVGFVAVLAAAGYFIWRYQKRRSLPQLLKRHFSPAPLDRIAVTERKFPTHIRADLQEAVDDFVRQFTVSSRS